MIWDYDKTEYQKQVAADLVWHLKRLINYGLGEEKLDRELLKKYLPELRISEDRRFFRVTPSLRDIVEELKSFFVDLAREVGTGVIRD